MTHLRKEAIDHLLHVQKRTVGIVPKSGQSKMARAPDMVVIMHDSTSIISLVAYLGSLVRSWPSSLDMMPTQSRKMPSKVMMAIAMATSKAMATQRSSH